MSYVKVVTKPKKYKVKHSVPKEPPVGTSVAFEGDQRRDGTWDYVLTRYEEGWLWNDIEPEDAADWDYVEWEDLLTTDDPLVLVVNDEPEEGGRDSEFVPVEVPQVAGTLVRLRDERVVVAILTRLGNSLRFFEVGTDSLVSNTEVESEAVDVATVEWPRG